jgi:hypothetical protein
MTDLDITPRKEFVEGLRELARIFETTELQLPRWAQDITVFLYSNNVKQEMARSAHFIGRADKDYSDEVFQLTKKLGNLLTLRIMANREEVCERVVVGKKFEPEHVIPAKEEQFVPAREIEVVEWRCTPLLRSPASVEVPEPQLILPSSRELLTVPDDDIPF